MHILNRLAVVGVLLVALVPLSTVALISTGGRGVFEDHIQENLKKAADEQQAVRSIEYEKSQSEKKVAELEKELLVLGREKAKARLKVGSLKQAIEEVQEIYGLNVHDAEQMSAFIEEQKEEVADFIGAMHLRSVVFGHTGPKLGGLVIARVLRASLGESTELQLQRDVLTRTRAKLLSFLVTAENLPRDLEAATQEYEMALAAYQAMQDEIDEAKRNVTVSDERLSEIRRVVAEVQGQIGALQRELHNIDERLRLSAVNNLVEKGLLSEESAQKAIAERRVGFGWPVTGRISAGYYDQAYARYFGVPHKGIDIVVSQGSPVAAAADGIVYLARDGGAWGYSYILIGHRNGYATLYGHLSSFAVSAGQRVNRGQIIGTSGGQPGSYGAGPMTTGPHLHFEVIQEGKHVSPMSVLP